ncbi:MULTISPECIES: hypothetical protein [unclassified Oceanobacter]|uniref:hypothetical protein n=1 Tax=unclassified Oceanobacter TaxID=2620260 RepID=UPI0026E15BED|nr:MULTISPECIES: hypothetical protein [unclassified Oceanobacter]MDO6681621.1 hypothetical protein [Oceanobacter sp. 5_MG-2023]MDP2505751.1 hypothetical protein [Oceanobacter sp. 3_MG-2023]MDP2547422.1 hypothetical protein [Oceanobacter sp. 4_MG-2023]MDP2608210.1 hypothetical protein [Oceanobacter sp. 1_MG-2023]MDP2612936.1 hypothetical protein [Oceanobacter sp. 2_MG-2023]
MTEANNESNQQAVEPPDMTRWALIGFVAGVILAVLAMEYYGFVKHPSTTDRARIDEFVLMSLEPGYDVKVSHKASGKEAFCVDGYLLLRPTNGHEVAGILVDSKNRPVACRETLGHGQPEADKAGE